MSVDCFRRRAIRRGVAACGWLALAASVVLAPSAASAADAFAHLPNREGGPDWTFESVAAEVGKGPSMPIEPGKPIPRVADAAAAIRAALDRLRAADAAGHAVAFRLVAATAGQTKNANAMRLLTLLQHHGVGGRIDKGGAIRTALDLVRAGDGPACAFVGRSSPAALWATAKTVDGPARLQRFRDPTAVQVALPILPPDGGNGGDGGNGAASLRVGSEGDSLPVVMTTNVADMKPGRVVKLAGVWADGVFTAYLGEVPQPDASFTWNVSSQSGRNGYTQIRAVRVVVHNKGPQPIQSAKLRVRCYVERGANRPLEHTVTADAGRVPAGGSQTIDVDFMIYNYGYDGIGAPKVEVTADKIEW